MTLNLVSDPMRRTWIQNRVLRTISGPKRQEITGGQRKLHNKELHNHNSSIKNAGEIMVLAGLTA
jgi:hypothetical protein